MQGNQCLLFLQQLSSLPAWLVENRYRVAGGCFLPPAMGFASPVNLPLRSMHLHPRTPVVVTLAVSLALCLSSAFGQSRLPALKVDSSRRHLIAADGTPFFYLGDTAWELFHRCTREQAVEYLELRAKQRYTVIQAVALAELQGLDDPNAHGDLPLVNADPARPAVTPGSDPANSEAYDYWDHVDFVVAEANRRGLYIGFLPSWAAWTPSAHPRPDVKVVFNAGNARVYGEFLGKRYGKNPGMIWILGGDRLLDGHEDFWRAMAGGIAAGTNGREDDFTGLIMTFHPSGGRSSSQWYHDEAWLSFNMQQTGHSSARLPAGQKSTSQKITDDYRRVPVKPVIDGEPLYEDHPIGFRAARENGYSFDAHIRQRAYWHVFSGAFGHTYGHHSVWQMYSAGKTPINGPLLYWHEAVHRPGAGQMQHLRSLIESRPMLSRVPDQSLIVDEMSGPDYIAATRGDGYAFIYSGQGRAFTVNLGRISGNSIEAWWYNPRNGAAEKIGTFANEGTREFTPHPIGGFGTDSVLVLDDAARRFPAPGSR